MTRIDIHNKLHYLLALLIAFTLPFGKLTPLFIALFLINWLVEGKLKDKVRTIFANKFAITFILFYVIHIVGLIYTKNMKSGLFDLEVKMSLLIFPLILSSKPLTKKVVQQVFIAFIVGLLYASLYMLSRSFSLFFLKGENTFFYQDFSVLVHSSYIAMYMNVAIVWLIFEIFKKDTTKKILKSYTSTLVILFFSSIIILLSSKSGILTLFVILVSAVIYYIFIKKKYLIGLVVGSSIFLGLFLVYNFVPQVKLRVDNFVIAVTSKNNTKTLDSTSVRMLIWESSNQIIKNNFIIGVGTGDAKDALNKEYEKKGINNALKLNFNAHNEFYQVFISLGIIGFVLLLMHLFYPFIHSFKIKDYFYGIFLLIIIFNFFSESMLETKAGVMFFAFFNSLLCFRKFEERSNRVGRAD